MGGKCVKQAKKTYAYSSQYYGCSRQYGRPVGARCSMGLVRNPLINGLIKHTFKFNFLFVEKFTVIPVDYTKLFSVDHKSPQCLRKLDPGDLGLKAIRLSS